MKVVKGVADKVRVEEEDLIDLTGWVSGNGKLKRYIGKIAESCSCALGDIRFRVRDSSIVH